MTRRVTCGVEETGFLAPWSGVQRPAGGVPGCGCRPSGDGAGGGRDRRDGLGQDRVVGEAECAAGAVGGVRLGGWGWLREPATGYAFLPPCIGVLGVNG